MYDEQVKEFESKLPAAFKPECIVRIWREDYGHFVCYEIWNGLINAPPGEILVPKLGSSHDVEVHVRLIANTVPVSWHA